MRPRVRSAVVMAAGLVVALAGLASWLGYLAHQSNQENMQRAAFVEAAKRQAQNLTTIDYDHVDADVKRIVDSSTGTFHDDFQKRSPAFIEVVRQAKSTTVGHATAAGLEAMSGGQAQVLVAVSVKTSAASTPEQQPQGWRMRITITKVGDDLKTSDVAFVS